MITKGDITKELHVGPGAPVTQESLRKAQEFWMELYLFFMIVKTTDPKKLPLLQTMQESLGFTNDALMTFLDSVIEPKDGD